MASFWYSWVYTITNTIIKSIFLELDQYAWSRRNSILELALFAYRLMLHSICFNLGCEGRAYGNPPVLFFLVRQKLLSKKSNNLSDVEFHKEIADYRPSVLLLMDSHWFRNRKRRSQPLLQSLFGMSLLAWLPVIFHHLHCLLLDI